MTLSAASDYETPEPNEWVRPVALAVLGLMIVWNCAGWIADKGFFSFEGAFLTLFTAGLMALGINASSQLRRAFARVETPAVLKARRFWQFVLVSTSLWSAGSAHHAYGQLVANEVAWGFTFEALWAGLNAAPLLIVLTAAAFFEPFLMWAIETVEHAARKRPGKPAEPLVETAANDETAETPHASRRRRNRAARRVASDLSRQQPEGVLRTDAPASQQRDATRGPPLSEAEIKTAVETLTKRGEVVSFRSVAKFHGVPVSRVERSPGRALLKAA